MNLRPFSIPLTMAVSFSLAFGVFWNRDHEEAPAPAAVSVTPAAASVAPAAPALRTVPLSAPGRTVAPPVPEPPSRKAPAEPAPDPRHAASAPTGAPPPSPSNEEVPVNFKIGQDRNSGEPRVLVQNQSGGPLLITVTATNPSTGNVSMARAAVDSSRNANLTALGLVVSPGDHITIKSPPYRDQSFDVR